MREKRQWICALFVVSLTSNLAFAQTSRPTVAPQVLYQRAWRLIKESYYDQKFGGQDWQRWEHHYDSKLKTAEDAHKAIETMLGSLNGPGADFLGQNRFDEEKSGIDAHQFGVGLQLGMSQEHKMLVTSVEDPASKSGIASGDEIVTIDGKSVAGFSADQVMHQIRGPVFTKVEICWNSHGKLTKAMMTRTPTPPTPSVSVFQLAGNIGYVRITNFLPYEMSSQLRKALATCKTKSGLILDLRDNPGGLIAQAVEVPSFFLKSGLPILSTLDADLYANTQKCGNNPDALVDLPMVVLIDKATANGAEIVASALQANNRSVIVGERSAGACFVKSINKLEDGSGINVTIARWLTASGADLNGTGIVPDVFVPLNQNDLISGKGPWWKKVGATTPVSGITDRQLMKAIELLRVKMRGQ